jgi:threonine-phosphate decarboxylase
MDQSKPSPPASDQDKFVQAQAHGGDIWGASRLLGIPRNEILDLSASLNPLGPPAGLIEEITRGMKDLCYYPDRQTWDLRNALAEKFGLRPGNVLPGNGSTNLIRLLSRALTMRNIVVIAPAFGEFARSLALAGAHFHFHPLAEKNNFSPTMDDLDKIFADSPSCIILSNPLTPSGGLVDREILDQLVAKAQRIRAWIVLDEAFMDFATAEARNWSPQLLEDNPRLVVLRSMTKFYCLAGLRLGYMLCSRHTGKQLAPLGEPWSVNTMAQRAGVFCLKQEEYETKTRDAVDKWRAGQAERLAGMGCHVYPSQVNYLLLRLPMPGPNAAQVAAYCAAKGVLVRDCSNFPVCTHHHLRVAVATPEEQERLYEVLEQALKQ